jgi:group I intron endonuclease
MATEGFIYKITCKTEGKSYIGQTTYSVEERYGQHLQKASTQTSNCRLVSEAIHKYGVSDITIETIVKVPSEELDQKEQDFIKAFNTLHPNGYNLTTGGTKGTEFCAESKARVSQGQIGNRRKAKERVHVVDKLYPKYVAIVTENGKILGCRVTGFPTGITEQEYYEEKFISLKLTMEQKLMIAKQCIIDLHLIHKTKLDALKKKRENKLDYVLKLDDYKFDLPEDVAEVKKTNKLVGYKCTKDNVEFITEDAPYKNLDLVLKYINNYDLMQKDKAFVPQVAAEDIGIKRVNGSNLPKNVSMEKNKKGEIIGYFINNYRFIQPDGTVKLIKKKFCSKKEPMEDKFNKCITYLNQLKAGVIPVA